ncbi:uncharacterized protein LOC119740150 [Patiria miniata]|uniref:Integrase core domain-containing protein n=1 Tax=Patiria miniata TaxID=46514 RepID=A0A914B4U8_PATMI|nr:uncharacterized protein LOC119740150 [Patiria miniata]
MHLRCIQNGLTVKRDTVRHLLRLLDPEGVEIRSRRRLRRRIYRGRGPNFIWHVDSNDKLKPYGICINGCIDGYSRNVLWVESYSTNSDPYVIAGYFIQTVLDNVGCPRVIRADFGTENSTIRAMQYFFRTDGQDPFSGARSFIQGSSQHNQRIECWWSVLRKHCLQFWMNLFEELKDNGDFCGDFLDKSLVQFCFMNLFQDDVDTIKKEWNSHRISSSRNRHGPFGRPSVMYSMPQLYGTQNFLVPVQPDEIEVCESECTFKSPYPCDRDVFDLCITLMAEAGITAPTNPREGQDLYHFLRTEILHRI